MAMKTTWGFEIPDNFHVDIQDIYYIKGSTERSGMAGLAGEIIDETYKNMKSKLPPKGHNQWEKQPLDEDNLRYAAIDGFVAFELYRNIQNRQKGLAPTSTKGTTDVSQFICTLNIFHELQQVLEMGGRHLRGLLVQGRSVER